ARGHHRRQGVGRLRPRRSTARARARWPRAHARPAPLLLEERQVDTGPPAPVDRRARLLGDKRLPQLRKPMAGTALLERLTWQLAELVEVVVETPGVKTLVFDVEGWEGHRAGQHVDVRLTAEDGYQAERSYSIASGPDDGKLELTVELIEDGEVSPYLVGELQHGDTFEVRGPIGGWFAWDAADGGPLLLVGGGSGVVPLRSMLRARPSDVPARLIYSARTLEDVIYRSELGALGDDVVLTLTREQRDGFRAGRVDADLLREAGFPPEQEPRIFVCGPTPFVESVASELVGLGHAPERVRTERFGPTGRW